MPTKRPAPKRRKRAVIDVRAVDFVMYNVSDMGRAKAFYRDVLGLKRGGEYTNSWAEFATEPSTLCLCAPKSNPAWNGPAAIALAVPNVHEAIEALRRK